jgi:hypothetical protein
MRDRNGTDRNTGDSLIEHDPANEAVIRTAHCEDRLEFESSSAEIPAVENAVPGIWTLLSGDIGTNECHEILGTVEAAR